MPGTLARLVVAIGIDDSQMTSGIARTRANVLSNLASLGAQAETQIARTSANITRSSGGFMNAIRGPVAGVLTGVIAVGAGLGYLAMKFESETAHIAASAGITNKAAEDIGNAFLAQATKGQSLIYTAQDITSSYAKVAGQMTLVEGSALHANQALGFMTAAENLAAASNSKLSDASSALAQVLQDFQLKAKDSAAASNVIFDASKGLNLSLPATADLFEKLRARVGGSLGSLTDVGALMEDMGAHAVRNQRNVNSFAGAINSLLGASANPAKLLSATEAVKTASLNLAAAQIKLKEAETSGTSGAAAHQLALNRLQVAEDELAIKRAMYPANSAVVVRAELAVEAAQVASTRATTTNAARVALAQISVQKALDALNKAQLAANGITGTSSALLKRLGIEAYDPLTHKFIGMLPLITELHNAFAGMNQQQQQAAATTIFGAQAASMMLGVINSGPAAYKKYIDNINQHNAAQEAARKAIHSLQGAWQTLVAQIQGAATTLSVAIAPFLTGLLKGVSADMPTILHILETGFGIIGTIGKAVWGPISVVVSMLAGHMWIVWGVLGFIILRFAVLKTLNLAKEFAGWLEPLAKLIAPTGPLRSLETLLDKTKTGSIGKGLVDVKNAWSDTFSTGQLVKAQQLGSAVEKSATQMEGMVKQLQTAAEFQIATPTSAGADVVKNLENSIIAARSKLLSDAENLFADPAVRNALTGNLEKGITNPRVLEALNGIMARVKFVAGTDAIAQYAQTVEDAIGKAAPTIAKDLVLPIDNAVAQMEVGMQSGFSKAISTGVKDAKVGDVVVADMTASLASKGGFAGLLGKAGATEGIISKAFGLAGKAATLLAQPVFIMGASPAYFAELKIASAIGGVSKDILSEAESVVGKVAPGAIGGTAVAGGAESAIAAAGTALEGGVLAGGIGAAAAAAVVPVLAIAGAGIITWALVNFLPKIKSPTATAGTAQSPVGGIFADLSNAAALGGFGGERGLLAGMGKITPGIVTALKHMGISAKNAETDAYAIEQAYMSGAIKTRPELDALILHLRTINVDTLDAAGRAEEIKGQFGLVVQGLKNHGAQLSMLLPAIESSLKDTSNKGSNTVHEATDIVALMEHGKITTATQLSSFETMWNLIPANTRDLAAAQEGLAQGVLNGSITNASQVKQYLQNWSGFVQNFGKAVPSSAQIAAYVQATVTPASYLPGAVNAIVSASSYLSGQIYNLAKGVPVYATTVGYKPGLAGGGPTEPNHVYWVGEAGRELFVSREAGQIIPENQIVTRSPAKSSVAAQLSGFSGPIGPVGLASSTAPLMIQGILDTVKVFTINPEPLGVGAAPIIGATSSSSISTIVNNLLPAAAAVGNVAVAALPMIIEAGGAVITTWIVGDLLPRVELSIPALRAPRSAASPPPSQPIIVTIKPSVPILFVPANPIIVQSIINPVKVIAGAATPLPLPLPSTPNISAPIGVSSLTTPLMLRGILDVVRVIVVNPPETPTSTVGRQVTGRDQPAITPSIPGFTPIGAASAVRQAPVIGTVIVNNPAPERAGVSVEQQLRQISYLGEQ
jgi:hypothetical protein